MYCPIPPDVAAMLLNVPASQKGNTNATYFFWTGEGLAKTVTSNWQRSYVKLFRLATLKEPDGSPKRCHPHMLRDTFAVESLLSGMRLRKYRPSSGHSSSQDYGKALHALGARSADEPESIRDGVLDQAGESDATRTFKGSQESTGAANASCHWSVVRSYSAGLALRRRMRSITLSGIR